ncbi:exodeoxyribonuclease V subunit beta [Morganella psychrotolerans]|uniref:RecBCD enzyme subunit RecB n=1 Tax=Morganella psychrotolerans TaxID=368603 RepID=A0A5M9R1I1_9GAMM|nr:exodeoxyribonuclease V subunit beta [Morganella psychrotolerans]KAA8714002.1 exodeoxyribonuclease V subunit beta [Morganella psychrotolerans]OBU03258.1 exodeoxyribonuclease V subunit beta [Morganella psychrotolerans]
MAAESLNPVTIPLQGQRLIEASAGTGKTYTIARLYLRLLLGLGEGAFSRPLSAEEILVVTFTEAATNELRGRIRENIHALRIACLRDEQEPDHAFAPLLALIPDKQMAAQRLLLAERQMDEAAIFTIHGFCQRMLTHNAFESGVLFEQTLIQDEHPIRRQACADFWRRHCYPLPVELARAVTQLWSGPDALLRDIYPWLQGEEPRITDAPESDETLLSRHQKIITAIDEVKQQWRKSDVDFVSLIQDSDLNKSSYRANLVPGWIAGINAWAEERVTTHYALPKNLERFSQAVLCEKTKKGGTSPSHPVFSAIETLAEQALTLEDVLFTRAVYEIRQTIAQEKQIHGEMGFDDLLTRLDEALRRENGALLAQTLRKRFPVAMIDEFQDTDPQQYRIFRTIYQDDAAHRDEDVQAEPRGLLFIGDPKQAIYAFRGADIFTYIKARQDVSAHYTLGTNYRSAKTMVDGVNKLFLQADEPFCFKQIPFQPVMPAPGSDEPAFVIDGKIQPAMQFWWQSAEGVSSGDYERTMAVVCAGQIRDWLQQGQSGTALLGGGDKQRPVSAADITVLVRSRREAQLIKDALNQLAIPSVFLSNRDSVFDTPEARELLWLLQAVLSPEKERLLRSSLASGLFGLNAPDMDELNHDETAWDALVDEFAGYGQVWQQQGVLPMLRTVFSQRKVAENLLAGQEGERRLTDIMHIGELLQETSQTLENEHALVRWLAQQVLRPDAQSESQQMRLESDQNLVQICTIHKSKGLEYPLVWLPFICNFQAGGQRLYHDETTFEPCLTLSPDETQLALADKERLAEDLRLLYVAVTRAVYHCSLGVAPVMKGNRKKAGNTDLHHCGLGYLIQNGQACDSETLFGRLTAFCQGDDSLALTPVQGQTFTPWEPQVCPPVSLAVKAFTRHIRGQWRVTSYSGLSYGAASGGNAYTQDRQEEMMAMIRALSPDMDTETAGEIQVEAGSELTAFTFMRGAQAGTFLHSLFEALEFDSEPSLEWLNDQLLSFGFSAHWAPFLQSWITELLNTPLCDGGPALRQIPAHLKQDEMQFFLPIESELNAHGLDALMRAFDPLSERARPLDFATVTGMLKGFIDLVFCHDGKYYIADYKSNYLGDSPADYQPAALADAMIEHRYDLQYQLYTLALHRYLRHRLPDYNYDVHFGGVYYLFLRGMTPAHPGQGIYFYRPEQVFTEQLDAMFKGETSK